MTLHIPHALAYSNSQITTLTRNLMTMKILKALLVTLNTPLNLHSKRLPLATQNVKSVEKYSHWSHLWDVEWKNNVFNSDDSMSQRKQGAFRIRGGSRQQDA